MLKIFVRFSKGLVCSGIRLVGYLNKFSIAQFYLKQWHKPCQKHNS